ncbi:MAG: GNAT family N-acetyltransferase [Patescibacteria group bacterium]|nr:GNAT family N-acetyltransferase [Patescibacteria group bacterium]MDD4610548.1 GNAT family N-acetyltransferase [Patescibacteria group bacterium]
MINFKVISDITEAKNIWLQLSYGKSIYDDWDFRYCFYKYFKFPLYFIVGYDADLEIGLLPLQYNPKDKYLEYFAEEFMEDNRLYIREGYEKYIPDFFDFIKEPVNIFDMAGENDFIKSLPLEDYKYVLTLDKISKFDDFLDSSFSAKRRRAFRKIFSYYEEKKPEILINNFPDIDLMIDLNIGRLKEESYFNNPFEREIFHDILQLNFDYSLVTLIVDNKKVAVSFSILYKGVYNYLALGADIETAPNIGKFLHKINIERAISLKAKTFDAGLGDCSWKKIWHLEKLSQHNFEKFLK